MIAQFNSLVSEGGSKKGNHDGLRGESRSKHSSQLPAGLEPYSAPLDRKKLMHLLRRTGFGANPATIDKHLGKLSSEVVDQLIEEAMNPDILPLPPEPLWANIPVPDRNDDPSEVIKEYNQNNRIWLLDLRAEWWSLFRTAGLREKLVLFWHDHFVTSVEVYDLAAMAYRYLTLLRAHFLGNFKDFVFEIGLTPAMLIYLNGVDNDVGNPNENYARELLELFTMSPRDRSGSSNYTQGDIEEIARALTGWTIHLDTFTSELITNKHDDGVKTIFGQQGSFGYSDVIDLIFNERSSQVAYYICKKIYSEFIYDEPDEEIVQAMADLFIENNFELAPVVSTLLKSAAFYDDQFIGSKIKSPVELISGLMQEVNYVPSHDMYRMLHQEAENASLGQIILAPPDVSGWPGHRSWISTDTLMARWSITNFMLYSLRDGQPLDLVAVFRNLPEANDPYAAFKLPVAIADHLLAVSPLELDIPEINEEFNGDIVNNPIPEDVLNGPSNFLNLAKIFLGDVPWYEWFFEEDGANLLLLDYVLYLSQLPEFQLT